MTLVFATNNSNKVAEIRAALHHNFRIVSLKEAGIDIEIPEPHNTLEANATEKSTIIYKLTGESCFSEDTGLEVDALHGAPGVKSARYSENEHQYKDNIEKLLHKMQGIGNRNARFRTIISLVIAGKETQFEGICEGVILNEQKGENGFGYDPVFMPNGATQTFAEMNMAEKTKYSHRAKAFDKLVNYLKQAN